MKKPAPPKRTPTSGPASVRLSTPSGELIEFASARDAIAYLFARGQFDRTLIKRTQTNQPQKVYMTFDKPPEPPEFPDDSSASSIGKPHADCARRAHELEEYLDLVRWGGDGGNNLD
jgi:hypothetical protein